MERDEHFDAFEWHFTEQNISLAPFIPSLYFRIIASKEMDVRNELLRLKLLSSRNPNSDSSRRAYIDFEQLYKLAFSPDRQARRIAFNYFKYGRYNITMFSMPLSVNDMRNYINNNKFKKRTLSGNFKYNYDRFLLEELKDRNPNDLKSYDYHILAEKREERKKYIDHALLSGITKREAINKFVIERGRLATFIYNFLEDEDANANDLLWAEYYHHLNNLRALEVLEADALWFVPLIYFKCGIKERSAKFITFYNISLQEHIKTDLDKYSQWTTFLSESDSNISCEEIGKNFGVTEDLSKFKYNWSSPRFLVGELFRKFDYLKNAMKYSPSLNTDMMLFYRVRSFVTTVFLKLPILERAMLLRFSLPSYGFTLFEWDIFFRKFTIMKKLGIQRIIKGGRNYLKLDDEELESIKQKSLEVYNNATERQKEIIRDMFVYNFE